MSVEFASYEQAVKSIHTKFNGGEKKKKTTNGALRSTLMTLSGARAKDHGLMFKQAAWSVRSHTPCSGQKKKKGRKKKKNQYRENEALDRSDQSTVRHPDHAKQRTRNEQKRLVRAMIVNQRHGSQR